MNIIFIFNNKYYEEFFLDFKYDIIYPIYNNKLFYKFQILNKYQIKIFWYDEDEILYTNDSYLYFSDIENMNYIKKVGLFHPEWKDQAIINYKENKIKRIGVKDSNEEGSFISSKDGIIINWDNWDSEEFYSPDNNLSFYKNGHYELLKSVSKENNFETYIFIHVCCIENWREVYDDMINNIINTGLYNYVKKIYVGVVGIKKVIGVFGNGDDINHIKKWLEKVEIIYIDENIYNYEILTINKIKEFARNFQDESNILYIHTKGVRRAGNNDCTVSWRKMMEYHLIEKWEECLKYLKYYDTLGCNLINTFDTDDKLASVASTHNLHYSGNFWWSKSSYLKKLVTLTPDLTETGIITRCRAENWVSSGYPNARLGILYNDYTNTHPYHRYIFENYRNLAFCPKLF